MKPSFLAVLAGFLAVAILAPYAVPEQQAKEPGGAKPYVSLWGADSKVKEKSYELITTPEQLATVWSKHSGKEETVDSGFNESGRPEVDFDRCLVIAIFEGDSGNTAGIGCAGIIEEEKTLTVRFRNRTYQTSGPGGGGRRASAYGFFVIP